MKPLTCPYDLVSEERWHFYEQSRTLFNTSDDTWKLDKNALMGKQMMTFKSKAKLLSKNWKKSKEDLKMMDLMEAYEMQL